ncbi:hypothetical protein [Vibrio sp. THAF190c]|uniref:hypothetical protein n=1 Tax=Vibrio sp. THAF190c TaxID=2587865 RepID=UPI00126794C7|nr:hypothetical protein [Vibrio sp. THAF190c]QFT12121.1 hypothetical protein FIV04_19510 [Vibrio sp. THAF190c]
MPTGEVAGSLFQDALSIATTLRVEENECINIATITYLELLNKGYVPELIVGSVECGGHHIFKCPAHFDQTHLVEKSEFDGHLWVECDNYIIDIAFLFTVRKSPTLQKFLFSKGTDLRRLSICKPINKGRTPDGLSYDKRCVIIEPELITTLELGAQNWLNGSKRFV